ncbi:hypothetical protein KQI38_00365 [Tissierella carlieri]|uniref:hypothetical protein n=1 Tax=Tissierella carlieri TaxID=689904 RepID=UPI001C10A8D9|nr:hypothetical protein [Tissierella carlieri]MBU5310469.1 hypothetical protein [Tissierella carlieri]
MKKNNHKNKEEKPLKTAMYIRVGNIEQLYPEAQQKHFKLSMENFQKGEECDADSNSEKEECIYHTSSTGI